MKTVRSNEWIRIMRWSRVNAHLSLSWLGLRSLGDASLIEGPLTASSGLLKFIPIYIRWHHAYPATLIILLSRVGLLHKKKKILQPIAQLFYYKLFLKLNRIFYWTTAPSPLLSGSCLRCNRDPDVLALALLDLIDVFDIKDRHNWMQSLQNIGL